jgi:hypothetical protein
MPVPAVPPVLVPLPLPCPPVPLAGAGVLDAEQATNTAMAAGMLIQPIEVVAN